jgi:hypothetical protein
MKKQSIEEMQTHQLQNIDTNRSVLYSFSYLALPSLPHLILQNP